MDPLSIALAVALALAVFAFGVLVGSLASSYRFRKKAALASMQSAMHPTAATVRPSEPTPAAPVPETAAPTPEAAPPAAPAPEALVTQVPPAAPAPEATIAAPVVEAGADSLLPGAGLDLPLPPPAEEVAIGAPLPVIPAVEPSEPAVAPAAALTDNGLESLLAEVAASEQAEIVPEPASMTPFAEEPSVVADAVGTIAEGAVPEVVWELPSELAEQPAPVEEAEAAAEPLDLGGLSWELPTQTEPAIEETPAAQPADAGLSWDLPLEAIPAFEVPAADESGVENEPAPLADLNWSFEPEALSEPGEPAPSETATVADIVAEAEALREPEAVWGIQTEAQPGLLGEIASEQVGEPAPVSEFAWELPGEATAEEPSEAAPDAEQGLTWVIEPEAELPPLFEAAPEAAEAAAEPGVQAEPEIEPSWLVEPVAGAGGEPELPAVAEPASVQGPVPEPDFTWPTPGLESGFETGVGILAETPEAPPVFESFLTPEVPTVPEPFLAPETPLVPEPFLAPETPPVPELPETFGMPAETLATDRPRAHVVAIPEATAEGAPENAPVTREAPPMPPVSPESIDMVAPVQMWFGDYAVAVKAGSKTHAQFRKYADVLLADLRDAGERNR